MICVTGRFPRAEQMSKYESESVLLAFLLCRCMKSDSHLDFIGYFYSVHCGAVMFEEIGKLQPQLGPLSLDVTVCL